MRSILLLTGYNIQESLYLFKNVSLSDIDYLGTVFGKEIQEYRINMSKRGL